MCLPELTHGLLGAVGPRGGRKGLETLWTQKMTFEESPERRPGVCQRDKAGRVFLVFRVTCRSLGI